MNRHFTEEDTDGKEAHDFNYIIYKSICVLLCCTQSLSHVLLFVTLWIVASQAPLSMGILQARRQECHALLQWIFPTQGSNPSLPHCRWILYHLNHQGNPRILEWVAYPSPRETSQPRNLIQVFRIARRFFTSCVTREAPCTWYQCQFPGFDIKLQFHTM